MVFSSSVFLFGFLPLTLLLYYLVPRSCRNLRNGILLAASLFFYGWGEPAFIFVMLLSIAINWRFVIVMERAEKQAKRKRILTLAIGYDILLMFVFKYLGFVFNNFALLFGSERTLSIALPIGISFFTFQIMSYVFDVYYGNAKVQTSFARLALYISMFPQLIAGPIVRYTTVEEEIGERRETLADFAEGFARFTVGLAKKALIANYVALLADNAFGLAPEVLSTGTAWIGILAYTLQIYFDFSGYSDMAIGLGKMFGFHFEENFNYPYVADSVTEFWRRWHISLSGWFRDYVYIPLGGNRKGERRTFLNLFTVWLLTGIWHGANWTFIVWGLYYFVFLTVEKALMARVKRELSRVIRHAYTLLAVMIGWVLFRAASLSAAGQYLAAMFGFTEAGLTDTLCTYLLQNGKMFLLLGVIASLPIVPAISQFVRSRAESVQTVYGLLRVGCVVLLFGVSLAVVIKSGYNPFIYFNF